MSMLDKLPLFKGLNDTALAKLDASLSSRSFDDGVRLFSQGDSSDAFYIIQQGQVRVLREEGEKELELALLSAGDFFGEMGVIDNAPRSASCITKGDTTLLLIERDEFLRMMATNPSISRQVMAAVIKRSQVALDDFPSSTSEGQKKERAAVVGFFSASGGVGTSFVVANVAASLKRLTAKEVIVVDLDLMFGDQGVLFDVKPDRSMDAFVGDEEVDEDKLMKTIMSTKSGVSLLQAPSRPENAEAIETGLIVSLIEKPRDHYDYILCDTANIVQEFNIHILEMVQIPIYVLTPDFLGLKNCSRWYKLMEKIKFPVSKIEFLLNKHESEADRQGLQWLEERFQKSPLASIPFEHDAAKTSIEQGVLLTREHACSEIADQIDRVAREIAGVEVEEEQEPWWKRWIPL